MKMPHRNFVKRSSFVLAIALLVSCSENNVTSANTEVSDGSTVASLSSLPKCTAMKEGITVYVQDEDSPFVCSNFEWVNVGAGASSVSGGDSEAYETACPSGQTCLYAPTEQLNPNISYGEFLDTRNNHFYKTVQIGSQVWMAQNLNYNSNFTDSSGNNVVNSWCGAGNNQEDGDCGTYGRLYLWSAAVDSAGIENPNGAYRNCGYGANLVCKSEVQVQGVCPSGWHLPSIAEFNQLIVKANETYDFGIALISSSFLWGRWKWGTRMPDGVDYYGFSAIPAGSGNSDSGERGGSALFWSSSEGSVSLAYGSDEILAQLLMLSEMFQSNGDILSFSKKTGLSVRCLKN